MGISTSSTSVSLLDPLPSSLPLVPLARRNHLVYTRDTLSHAHTPDPPCSSASSHFSPSWRPGAAPACSSPCLGIGLNPASSGRDASAPNPSPPPRTQRPQRRPAVPSQPPTFVADPPKNPPKQSLASPNPLWGFGLARDCSPLHPHPFPLPPRRATQPSPRPRHIALPQPRPPAPHPDPPVAGPARARLRPSQKSPRRTSRVFWKKLLLRARPPFRPPMHPAAGRMPDSPVGAQREVWPSLIPSLKHSPGWSPSTASTAASRAPRRGPN